MLNRIFAGWSFARLTPISSLLTMCAAIVCGCASSAGTVVVTERPMPAATLPGEIAAVGVHQGALYLALAGDGACELRRRELSSDTSLVTVSELRSCPDRITSDPRGLVLQYEDHVDIIASEGVSSLPSGWVVAASEHEYVAREDGVLVWHREDSAVRLPALEEGTVMLAGGGVVGVEMNDDTRQMVRFDVADDGIDLKRKVLIESIGRVDWIAIDDDEKEMAISAERGGSLDVALANLEEPVTNWIFPDPADEERPRFSPVGYKLSYVIRNPGGDILRTVHVPTAAMVLLDFPHGVIRDYVWLPDGERVLVAVSSPLASDHVVEATYEGSTRRILVEPELSFDRDVDRLPGTAPGSLLVLPSELGYGDRRPLVIWSRSGDRDRLDFDPDLIPLLERSDIGIVIVSGSISQLSPSASGAIAEAPWVDEGAIFIVGEAETSRPDFGTFIPRASGEDAARRVLEAIDEGGQQR